MQQDGENENNALPRQNSGSVTPMKFDDHEGAVYHNYQ